MRYGLAAWGLRETPLAAQLQLTSGLGLELLELSIANGENDALQLGASDRAVREVREAFADHRVRLECGCTGNDFTGDDVEEQLRRVREAIDIAARLGLRFLRIFAGFRSDSEVVGERFTRLCRTLADAHAHAAPRGVTLCVETHGGVRTLADGALYHFQSVSTRIDCWRELLRTGVSIAYDPANLAAAGATDPAAFGRIFRDRIAYLHLKDFRDVPGGVRPAACGEGRLVWPELIPVLRDFAGPAMIEYELPGDVADGMARSLAFLKTRFFSSPDRRQQLRKDFSR